MLLRRTALTIFSLLLVAMGVVVFLMLCVAIGVISLCKAGTNKPTPLQEAEMAKIRQAQGLTLVVNEDNIADVQDVFTTIDKGLQ